MKAVKRELSGLSRSPSRSGSKSAARGLMESENEILIWDSTDSLMRA